MRKIITLSLAAAATFAISGGAQAQAQADNAPALTRAQVQERSAAAFARLDANQDGVLNQADREAARGTREQQRFDRIDANDDGELNQADREARRQQAFDRIDADRSGGISREEFAALRERRQELRGDRAGPDGPRMGRRGRGGPGMARAADTDNDGAISQAEFASAALARFDRVDANKDGTIGADERPAPRRMMRMMRRPRDAG